MYSEFMKSHSGLFLNLIRRLENDTPVDLTPGEQVRDLLFEDDVVNALLQASESDGLQPYQVYNVCSARPVRIREVGEAVADALNKPRELLHTGASAAIGMMSPCGWWVTIAGLWK
jgi:nucleoside-diphosphate-sugar epimerase